MPDLRLEKRHLEMGAGLVIGIDEAGRGPWAGPVTAAAFWINPDYFDQLPRELNDSIVITKFYRKFLGIFFRIFSNLLLDIKLRDTQCGFKLYKKKVAKKIFSNLASNGFEHDLEIVLLAKKNNLDIIELPVHWTHMPGSKLNIFTDPIKMLIGILQIRSSHIK